MDGNSLDSNLIEMMVEETLGTSGRFSVSFDEYSSAYKITINGLHLEVPSNWDCLTVNKSGDIFFPEHFLDVLQAEAGLGTLESVSIVKAFDNSLQLDVRVSNLLDLNVA